MIIPYMEKMFQTTNQTRKCVGKPCTYEQNRNPILPGLFHAFKVLKVRRSCYVIIVDIMISKIYHEHTDKPVGIYSQSCSHVLE